MMELVPFGRTDLQVSRLCLGAMNFGSADWGCDERAAAEIVRVYRDSGGNFFDTANVYAGGESERILGRLVAGERDHMVIASKVGFPSPDGEASGLSAKSIRASVEGTLRRLDTDYLDLYQLHAFDDSVPLDETLAAMYTLVDEGLVRYVGCSNFFAWQIAHADAISWRDFGNALASAQMMYNLVRRDIEREHLGYAQQVELALIAYSPLHGGQLAAGWRNREEIPAESRAAANPEVYLSDEARVFQVTAALVDHATQAGVTSGQMALAWVMRNPAITTTLTAARDPDELREQLKATTLDIDPDLWTSLDRSTALPISYPADFYGRLNTRGTPR